jgi:ferredoxin
MTGVHFKKGKLQVAVPCYRGLNLLGHAQLEELDLGSRCGGHGVCGRDRVQILPGSQSISPPSDSENQHLSPAEIADGWRLACQTWPAQDQDEIWVKLPEGNSEP